MIRGPSVLLSFTVAALGVLAACNGTSPTSSSSTEGIAPRGSGTDEDAMADASAAGAPKVRIPGTVVAILALDPSGDSRFRIRHKTLPTEYTVVARRGYTTIWVRFTKRTVANVTPGKKLHVMGDWLPSSPARQQVLAKGMWLQAELHP